MRGRHGGWAAALLAASVLIAPAADAGAKDAPSARAKASILTNDLRDLERSGALRAKVSSRQPDRMRVTSSAGAAGTREKTTFTAAREITLRRAQSRTVELKLTAAGKQLLARQLRDCASLQVVLSARPRSRPAASRTAESQKRLQPRRSRCANTGTKAAPPGSPGSGSAATDPGTTDDRSPPGANDFSCRPSTAHPRPVVLVHGLGARAYENWQYMSPRIHDAGYCVFALTYGVDDRTMGWPYRPGGTIPMEQSSPQLAAFIDRVLAATGASQVDLVGHSEGTVMPRWYLERLGGAAKVRHFIALTPLWRGTDTGGAATLRDLFESLGFPSQSSTDLVASFCGSCPQFMRGSAYLNDLNADGEAVPGIVHTNIVTRYDVWVVPYTSGIMQDGGTNIVLQDVCPVNLSEHSLVAFDPAVVQMILNGLDPANAQPVQC